MYELWLTYEVLEALKTEEGEERDHEGVLDEGDVGLGPKGLVDRVTEGVGNVVLGRLEGPCGRGLPVPVVCRNVQLFAVLAPDGLDQ